MLRILALFLLFLPFMAGAQASCPNFTHNLSYGSRGADVVQLQNFLISQGHLAAGNNTGYYGNLTVAAVQKFQCAKMNICSGSLSTNGWGSVGPKTRDAIARTCSSASHAQTNYYSQAMYGGGYAQSSYNTYSQATYYSQGSYTGYSQGSYNAYSQAAYYSQGSYNSAGASVSGEVIVVDPVKFGQGYPTWNPHLPKLTSDGVWEYAAFTHYPLDVASRYAKIYKKKVGTSAWTETGITIASPHQAPGLVIDTSGKLHVAFSCVIGGFACVPGGFNSTANQSSFYDMIFTKKLNDGSVDVSSIWNYSEWPGVEYGYMGIGTNPATGETRVSLNMGDNTGGPQKLFKVGAYSPTFIDVQPIRSGDEVLYPTLASNSAGSTFYSVNNLQVTPGVFNSFSYSDIFLYRMDSGTLTKVFSDTVSNPTGIERVVYTSDLAFAPDGRLYMDYYKATGIGDKCNYLIKEKSDGTFTAPTKIGCFDNTRAGDNAGPYVQLQIDSRGYIYALTFTKMNFIVKKSTDDGATWTDYAIPVSYLPAGTVSLTQPSLIKPWTSPKTFNPDRMYGLVSGHDANDQAWYLATFCIDLPNLTACPANSAPPPLTLSIPAGSSLKVGDTISVSWNNAMNGMAKDWIAMVPAGAHYDKTTWPGKSVSPWFYTDGAISGIKTLTAPAAGNYELVYLVNDGFTERARSAPFTVSPGTTVTDSLSGPSSAVAGQPLSISWVKTGALTAKDWIAIVPSGQPWVAGNPWTYTGGGSSGSQSMIAPALPGNYDLVYFVNDSQTIAIRTGGLNVTAPPLVALTPGTQTPKAGAALAVSWYVTGQTNAKDWVALVPQGQKWSSSYPWFYTDAAKSGTKTITLPTATGVYDLVYFANESPSVEVYRNSSVVTVTP